MERNPLELRTRRQEGSEQLAGWNRKRRRESECMNSSSAAPPTFIYRGGLAASWSSRSFARKELASEGPGGREGEATPELT